MSAPPVALLIAFSALFSPFAGGAAFAADASLIGCWHGLHAIQYVASGASRENKDSDCSLSFSDSEIHSSCVSPTGNWTYEYSYKVTKPGTYTATITASSTRPDLIGSFRDYRYRVEADHLFITTYPPMTLPAPPSVAVRVESDSIRVACKR